MTRFLTIAIAAVALMGGALAWQLIGGQQTARTLPAFSMAAEAQSNDEEETPIDTSLVKEMTLGDPDAPLTIVEYASATCPHCRNFHQTTFKQVKENYIDTGKVHFIYREVYFDRFGLWAGLLARCGDGERYFGIMDMIYEQQREWTQGENAGAIADNLARIGRTAGFTSEEVDACLQNGDLARAMIAVYQENAERDNIRSTPSFLIDGDLITGDQSYAAFSALIDAALAE